MIWIIISLAIMILFYGIYFGKLILQKKRGIKTDQIAKRKVKDKVFYTELFLKLATYFIVPTELLSIIFQWSCLPAGFRIAGAVLGFAGVGIFGAAVYAMKDSWRAGLAEGDDRKMIKEGIYKYSRNPAFLGFDLVYVGLALMYCNLPLIFCSLFAMVMLHVQIKQEEAFLPNVFEEEYTDYCEQVSRYFGRKSKKE